MSTPSAPVAEYLAARVPFIEADRSLRRENLTASLRSPKEIEADNLVRKIRAHEAATVWKEEYEDVALPFPGMEFLTGKKIIMKTKIFEIISKVRSAIHVFGMYEPKTASSFK